MKSSAFPSLRVEPELREAAESVPRDGATLTSLLETSVAKSFSFASRDKFIARGLRSREDTSRSGIYHHGETVHLELRQRLDARRKSAGVSEGFEVWYADSARGDLLRLFDFLLDWAQTEEDFESAQLSVDVIRDSVEWNFCRAPFVNRKAGDCPLLRESLIRSAGRLSVG